MLTVSQTLPLADPFQIMDSDTQSQGGFLHGAHSFIITGGQFTEVNQVSQIKYLPC